MTVAEKMLIQLFDYTNLGVIGDSEDWCILHNEVDDF